MYQISVITLSYFIPHNHVITRLGLITFLFNFEYIFYDLWEAAFFLINYFETRNNHEKTVIIYHLYLFDQLHI